MRGSSDSLWGEWGCWARLGWFDIVSRYRRTTFGPLWISVMTALTVLTLGFVYGTLFRIRDREFIPYLAIGFVTWSWISASLTEASSAFAAYKPVMLNQSVHPSSIVVRVVVRNLIVLAHNFVVVAIVLPAYGYSLSLVNLLLIPGVLLVGLLILAAAIILAIGGTRYRDLQQLLVVFLGMGFLVTPVIWSPEILVERRYIATLNPFTHLLDVVRMPLLGRVPEVGSWFAVASMAVIVSFIAASLMRRCRFRIPFWL